MVDPQGRSASRIHPGRHREVESSKNSDTLSSAPKESPRALPEEMKARIIAKRLEVRRCAQVVHALLVRDEVDVSLSSVKRIVGTYCVPLKRKSAWARTRTYPPRPDANHPGALVEMDTVHFFDRNGSKRYVYTALAERERTPRTIQSNTARRNAEGRILLPSFHGYSAFHRLVQHRATAPFADVYSR
jgi:hypothetical protein